MEVFAEGFQPREVQFAIVEQNPTLLNITLFAENTHRIDDPEVVLNKLEQETGEDEDDLEDKIDIVDEEEESTGLFGLPNPFAGIQKNIQNFQKSLLENIPFVGK